MWCRFSFLFFSQLYRQQVLWSGFKRQSAYYHSYSNSPHHFHHSQLYHKQALGFSKQKVILFTILFLAKMAASAALVSYIASLDFVKIQTLYIKMIVDSILFFVSYAVQKLFIF